MDAPSAAGPGRLPEGFVERLKELLGDRLQTGEAIRLEHGKSETHFAPMPPDAVAFAMSTDEVVFIVKVARIFS